MKRILLSMGSILFVSALLAGGTGAYLSDFQTSTGNTFASGILSLKFDNESYYTDVWGNLALSTSTTWGLQNPVALAGKKFFNFFDVKPGDIGEDTISIHINNNNAWTCMNIKLTGTQENGQPEPESLVDQTTGANQGELQNALHFAFWADDGDNVYEKGEKVFVEGTSSDIFNGSWWTLADSASNIWSEPGGSQSGGGGYQCDDKGHWYNSDKDSYGHDKGGHKKNDPLDGGETYYIGKAWCFGSLVAAPLNQDNKGKTGNNGPLKRGTGFTCNGAPLGNEFQSDGVTLDVTFNAVQARDNNSFLCSSSTTTPPGGPTTGTSTLFADNFESYGVEHFFDDDYNDPKWDVSGNDVHTHKISGTLVANLEGGHTPATQRLITQSISTLGYHDITLSYTRTTDDDGGPVNPQTLVVEYSVNGGGSWATLETVSGESPAANKSFSLSPAADNKAGIKVRFTFNGTNGTNHAYIDNVALTGVTP